jgi:hypothetical protein
MHSICSADPQNCFALAGLRIFAKPKAAESKINIALLFVALNRTEVIS